MRPFLYSVARILYHDIIDTNMKNLFIIFLFTLFIPLGQGKSFFTKGLKNKVVDSPNFKSKIIVVLDRGTKVQVISKKKIWYKIKTTKGVGWLSKMLLSVKPPRAKVSILDNKVDISTKARKRASNFTSAAAARGLRENSSDIFKNLSEGDYKALIKMEKKYVSNEEGLVFLLKGVKR